jgi:antitoxin component YwqK of YwqJK toxin-antitoxin module
VVFRNFEGLLIKKHVNCRATHSIVVFSIVSFLLLACEKKRERKNFYYSNGQLKQSLEYLDNQRDGWDFLYDSLGNLLIKQKAVHDSLVFLEEYFPTGEVKRKGEFIGPGHFRKIDFFRNGNIRVIHLLKNELTESVEVFKEDGTRDTIPYPLFTNLNVTKSEKWYKVKPGVIQMHCIIVNISGDISNMYAGELTVARKRDKKGILRDTIQLVMPDDKLNYFFDYPDMPNDTIWLQVLYGAASDTVPNLSVRTLAIWDEKENASF